MGKPTILAKDFRITEEGGLVFIDYQIDHIPVFAFRRHDFLRALKASTDNVREWRDCEILPACRGCEPNH